MSKVSSSFNMMESVVWSFADNWRLPGSARTHTTYVCVCVCVSERSVTAASEWTMYGADKVGNSSASSRGSLQQALPAFGAGSVPYPYPSYTVCSCFAFSHWPRPHQSDRWTSFEHDTPVPCLALWHRSQYSRAPVITELPFNILN